MVFYHFHKFYFKVINVSKIALAIYTAVFVLIFSELIHLIEPKQFPTLFDGFWWVMVTITTVGYGDFYPTTVGGRILAIFLFVFGISLVGMVLGKIAESLTMFKVRREEGRMNYHGKDHIIVIGWSQKAAHAIEDIHKKEPDTDIVLIDELEKTPLPDTHHVIYVRGSSTKEETLTKANITKCKSALIFSDDSITDAALVDGKSLLIASTIERISPEVYTVVEIRREEHIANFSYIKVDDFIISHEMISRLAVKSALARENFENKSFVKEL